MAGLLTAPVGVIEYVRDVQWEYWHEVAPLTAGRLVYTVCGDLFEWSPTLKRSYNVLAERRCQLCQLIRSGSRVWRRARGAVLPSGPLEHQAAEATLEAAQSDLEHVAVVNGHGRIRPKRKTQPTHHESKRIATSQISHALPGQWSIEIGDSRYWNCPQCGTVVATGGVYCASYCREQAVADSRQARWERAGMRDLLRRMEHHATAGRGRPR